MARSVRQIANRQLSLCIKYIAENLTVVQRNVEQQCTVPINSWVMDQRLWDHLLKNHNQQLNSAGLSHTRSNDESIEFDAECAGHDGAVCRG